MALALSVGFLVDTLCDAGLGDAVVKQPEVNDDFLRSVTTVQAGIGLVLLALSAAVAAPIAAWFKEPQLVYVLPAVVSASLFNAVSLCPLALLRRQMNFKGVAIRNFGGTLVGGVFGYLLALQGYGVWSLVGLHVANALTGAVVSCLAAGYLPRPTLRLEPLRPLYDFAWRMTGTRLLENSLARFDQFIVGSVFGTNALGMYALAGKLFDTLFSVACTPFADVILSKLARHNADRREFARQFLSVIHFASLVGPFAFCGAALFLATFLGDLFGKQWQDAAPFIWIVLGFGTVQSVAYVNGVALVALGLARIRLNLALLSTIMWAITITLLFRHGALMAAVAWACRVCIIFPVQVYCLSRELQFGWRRYWQSVQAGVIVGVMMMLTFGAGRFASSWLGNPLWWRLLVLALCALSAVAVALTLSDFARGRCLQMMGLIKRKLT
jgi:PST family polysaccharide transporter